MQMQQISLEKSISGILYEEALSMKCSIIVYRLEQNYGILQYGQFLKCLTRINILQKGATEITE